MGTNERKLLIALGKLKPEQVRLDPRWSEVWDAWHELNLARAIGFAAPCPIAHSEILSWLRLQDVPRWRWRWFATLIGRMENVWREEQSKRDKSAAHD